MLNQIIPKEVDLHKIKKYPGILEPKKIKTKNILLCLASDIKF